MIARVAGTVAAELVLLRASASVRAQWAGAPVPAAVVRVIDGDTVDVLLEDGRRERPASSGSGPPSADVR